MHIPPNLMKNGGETHMRIVNRCDLKFSALIKISGDEE